jgi:CubicO group peptidase (beta-lactamase class C family)
MTAPYIPPAHGGYWQHAENGETGLDVIALTAAAAYAAAFETPWSRDLATVIGRGYFEPPPWNEIIGPVAPRGGPNGLVLHKGLIVTEWGDTSRVDMTFSVAKSYLGLIAGIAVERGLIGDLDEPIARRVDDGGFASAHNVTITWRHMLQQTSEWEGTLWGKPDIVDRSRDLAVEGQSRGAPAAKGTARPLQEPGSFWEYNDVRVNRLSLALLRLFGRSLPDVFDEAVMTPIGASGDWEWHGYRESYVEIDGRRIQSVSGGGHWGGGVFIGARDQARLGLMMARRGIWGARRVLSEHWIDPSTTPSSLNPQYGFLWWLNTARQRYPNAPANGYSANGAGGNITWIDPANDLVAVVRWIDPAKIDGFLARLYASLPQPRRA